LAYYPCTTREPFERQGRITERIRSGEFFHDFATPDSGIELGD
jgi:ferredoxin--NADP+ reductase